MNHLLTVPEAHTGVRPPRLCLLSIAIPGLVGLLFAWLPLIAFHDPLPSSGYDGSVYLGASILLAHGVLPYRDFVFVHPPGIALLLFPIALASRITGTHFALSLSHALTLVVMGLNSSLVALALRFKGSLASFAGGMTCALFAWSMTDDMTVKLEPYLLFFCLLAMILAFSGGTLVTGRRVLLVGVALGLAGTVKIWAIFPALVIIGFYAVHKHKEMARLCIGMLVGFGVPSFPFFLAAPREFVHDVIISQVTRGVPTFVPMGATVVSMGVVQRLTILSHYAFNSIFSGRPWVAVVVVILIAATYAVRWRLVSQFEWSNLAALFVTVTVLLVPSFFSTYYVYFPEVFFALVLGGVVAVWAEALGRIVSSKTPAAFVGGHVTPDQVARGAVLVLVLALSVTSIPAVVNADRSFTTKVQNVAPISWIDSQIPAGSCVVSDYPYFTIAADRFVFAKSGCPAIDDPYGTWLAADPDNPPPSPADLIPSLTVDWLSWFAAADYVVLDSIGNQWVPWTSSLSSWFELNFVEVGSSGPLTIYRNRSFPTG